MKATRYQYFYSCAGCGDEYLTPQHISGHSSICPDYKALKTSEGRGPRNHRHPISRLRLSLSSSSSSEWFETFLEMHPDRVASTYTVDYDAPAEEPRSRHGGHQGRAKSLSKSAKSTIRTIESLQQELADLANTLVELKQPGSDPTRIHSVVAEYTRISEQIELLERDTVLTPSGSPKERDSSPEKISPYAVDVEVLHPHHFPHFCVATR